MVHDRAIGMRCNGVSNRNPIWIRMLGVSFDLQRNSPDECFRQATRFLPIHIA